MPGFSDIGDFFAGNHAGNEMAYQKGMALGANTQNAMAQARERIRQNTAIERLQTDPKLAQAFGLGDMTDATVTAMAGGLNPVQIMDTRLKGQEAGFRDIAGSPDASIDAGARNRALAGVASGPVETFKAVGSKGYQDVFHPDQGVIPLGPEFNLGAGGGDAASIQLMRAFGFLDEHGRVLPGKEKQAFDVMRTTGKTVDEGGVPGVVDFNPFAQTPRGAAAPHTGVAPGLGDVMAPPMAAAPPPVAGTGAVAPISSAARVASNTADIEKAKVIGKGAGEAAVALPKARAVTAGQTAGADNVIGMIDKTLKKVGPWTAGPVGGVLGFVPGTDAYDFKREVERIQANVGFKELSQMRHESPTGGALGNVTERELTFLQSTMGNLAQAQSPQQLAEMLTDIRDSYDRFKQSLARDMAAAATTAGMGGTPPRPAATGAAAYADPAKEARYQAWKAAQGAK